MFDGIFEAIEEWMRELLTGMVTSNLTTMFTDVNEKTGEIAAQVGQTPQGWNGSIFSLIQNLSNSVIVPIAGVIITFVLCYELITMLTEKNNMHEIDTWMFFKYFFKMWVAVYLVSNTFTIAMAVFDVGQHVVNAAGGSINSQTAINVDSMIEAMNTAMESMEIGELVTLALETMVVSLCMKVMSVLITVILFGRMIEIYLYTSIAPIPFATMSNREWGQVGTNYFRGLLALGFQGFFMMVCVGIYGTFWLNIADCYSRKSYHGLSGCKPKELMGLPWLLALTLRKEGWFLRSDIIWQKDNPMPESAKDRPSRCYEHIFLLTKSGKYFYDNLAVAEPIALSTAIRYRYGRKENTKYADGIPGQMSRQQINNPCRYGKTEINPLRNKRDVWNINTVPYKGAHFAAFPPRLAETCILAGCPKQGIVLDPFMGSGTTGAVAKGLNRQYIGIELNEEYCRLAEERIKKVSGDKKIGEGCV